MASLCIFREVRRGLEFRSNQGSFLTAGFIKNNYIWTCNLKISKFISGCVRPWGIAEKDLHFLEINLSADVEEFVMPEPDRQINKKYFLLMFHYPVLVPAKNNTGLRFYKYFPFYFKVRKYPGNWVDV